ncbi:MAG: hypothetical protein D6689_12510 [Deltaproteobacteria bacterium]|nr:MAG: hypothetical protein D6689_12510 [Deltaproteobacteria bacterium]
MDPGPDAGTAPQPDADVGGGEPDAEPVNVDPLAEWSGCMNLTNWDASGMATWADKPTEGGTVCSSCHGDGLARFFANTDDTLMFTYNRYETFITGFFTIGTRPDGTVDIVPAYAKLDLKGGGANNHPTFAVGDADPYYQALETFYQLTLQRRQAGLCDPPGFPTPTPNP